MSRKSYGRKLEVYKIDNYDPIEIRFDSSTSTFHAEFLGKEFTNSDINKLKSEMVDESLAQQKTTWKPVIMIKTGDWWLERRASGIEIEKQMLGSTIYPDGTIKQYIADVITRMHEDNLDPKTWSPNFHHKEWKGNTKETRIIDYTKERYQTLMFIEHKMKEFKERLMDIVNSDKSSDFIDALTESRNVFLQDEFSKKRLYGVNDDRK